MTWRQVVIDGEYFVINSKFTGGSHSNCSPFSLGFSVSPWWFFWGQTKQKYQQNVQDNKRKKENKHAEKKETNTITTPDKDSWTWKRGLSLLCQFLLKSDTLPQGAFKKASSASYLQSQIFMYAYYMTCTTASRAIFKRNYVPLLRGNPAIYFCN